MNFNLKTAQQYANIDDTETWIHAYLNAGDWRNSGLSDGLKLQKRWWIGPVSVPLSLLIRCCGPEPEMAYQQPLDSWENRVSNIQKTLTTVEALPPLIATYDAGTYSLRDGNHRHEAMRRNGWTHCYTFIWYNDETTWQTSPYQK
ncbi:MAG: chromosome partitioning protein ParB [Aggregatilineales bacterium]